MAKCSTNAFEPDYAVIPGKTLAETLDSTGMTQSELAERTGLARKTINGIINGCEPITPDTAIQLEKVFRIPAQFWINLQNNYEEAIARLREKERLTKYLNWIKEEEIPYKELIRRKAIAAIKDPMAQLTAVLTFFGVASPEEYQTIWSSTQEVYSFRKSNKHHVSFGAVSAWLRLGELEAAQIECLPFDKTKCEEALAFLRNVVSENIVDNQHRLRDRLAACGVALVFVPGITGAPIYGATRWLAPNKAILQMSLRGKDDGNFWFTLFHELGHILLHGKKDIFLEVDMGETTEKEKAADDFARNRLIPAKAYRAFIGEHGGGNQPESLRLNKVAICAFAAQVKVSPGVIVGRLQREGWLSYSFCNDLKVRLGFVE